MEGSRKKQDWAKGEVELCCSLNKGLSAHPIGGSIATNLRMVPSRGEGPRALSNTSITHLNVRCP